MRTVLTLLLGTVRRLGRSRRDLLLESLALRHGLATGERRPRVRNPVRHVSAQVLRRWPGWRDALLVLEPATVVGVPGSPHQRRAVLGGLHQAYIWAA